MGTDTSGATKAMKQVSIAEEILRLIDTVEARAENVTSQIEVKLEPITLSETPSAGSDAAGAKEDIRDYPPLFDTIRLKVTAINTNLDRIESVLRRVAL